MLLAVYPEDYCPGQSQAFDAFPQACNRFSCFLGSALVGSRVTTDLTSGSKYYVIVANADFAGRERWRPGDNVVLTIAPPVRQSHRAAD